MGPCCVTHGGVSIGHQKLTHDRALCMLSVHKKPTDWSFFPPYMLKVIRLYSKKLRMKQSTFVLERNLFFLTPL